ncbi:MAG: transcriptional regulator [Prolixibacteraceae bacterium]
MKNWKILKNEDEYNRVLARIEELMDSEPNTPDGDELELLMLLAEHYEENNFPHADPDPVEVIKYYIELRGWKQKDLVGIIGDKSLVSKVINKERGLNLRMIKNLHDKMKIPYSLLLQE